MILKGISEQITFAQKQQFKIIGRREMGEPAFLTCDGSCSKNGIVWTEHKHKMGSIYTCITCGDSRRWGLAAFLEIANDFNRTS